MCDFFRRNTPPKNVRYLTSQDDGTPTRAIERKLPSNTRANNRDSTPFEQSNFCKNVVNLSLVPLSPFHWHSAFNMRFTPVFLRKSVRIKKNFSKNMTTYLFMTYRSDSYFWRHYLSAPRSKNYYTSVINRQNNIYAK